MFEGKKVKGKRRETLYILPKKLVENEFIVQDILLKLEINKQAKESVFDFIIFMPFMVKNMIANGITLYGLNDLTQAHRQDMFLSCSLRHHHLGR